MRGLFWILFVVFAAAGLASASTPVAVHKKGGTIVLTNLTPGREASTARRGASSRGASGETVPVMRVASSPRPYATLVKRISDRYGIDHNLVHAIIAVESAYDPLAVSRQGAVGLMQLLPSTAAELGVHDLTNAHDNIVGGVRHLRRMLDRFSGDLTLALAAYNAGAGAVKRFQGVPPYPETQAYVRRVRRFYRGSGRITHGLSNTIYRYTDAAGVRKYTQFAPSATPERRGGHRR